MSGTPRSLLLGGLTILLAALSSCIQPAQQRYEEFLLETPQPAQHAVHSERLREIMRNLERLTVDRLPQSMDLGVERQRRIEEVARIALGMAATADRIPDVLTENELDEVQRNEFLRLAQDLHDSSLELSRRAPELTLSKMSSELDAIDAICKACHRRFRASLPKIHN